MKKPTPEIIAAERLTDTRWLRLFRVDYRLADRGNRTWMVATRNARPRCTTGRFEKPDAVIIVAYHRPTSRIVVTREYRVALADDEYGFPAGLVEADESVKDAARRTQAAASQRSQMSQHWQSMQDYMRRMQGMPWMQMGPPTSGPPPMGSGMMSPGMMGRGMMGPRAQGDWMMGCPMTGMPGAAWQLPPGMTAEHV